MPGPKLAIGSSGGRLHALSLVALAAWASCAQALAQDRQTTQSAAWTGPNRSIPGRARAQLRPAGASPGGSRARPASGRRV